MAGDDLNTYYSRSVLAEKLGVSLKELTQLLIDAGWVLQQGKDWQLTTKGEFEGGRYRSSQKYGNYIVWPESVLSHPMMAELTQRQITATVLAKHYTTTERVVSAKTINRLLAEMGWLSYFAKGWQLTSLGEINGGVQHKNSDTGIPYATWPRTLLDSALLRQQVEHYQGVGPAVDLINGNKLGAATYRSLDGHCIPSRPLFDIANWLYLSGLAYAFQRHFNFSTDESLTTDFYLPREAIHIHYNDQQSNPSELSHQLKRQSLAKKYALNTIELSFNEHSELDKALSKALLKWGVEFI